MGNADGADSPLLNEALTLAALGLRVLPVRSARRSPGCGAGRTLRPAIEREIREWPVEWSSGNLGVALGRGLIAVDIDPRNKGDESLVRLIANHGSLPVTAEARTGSGGSHFLFRVPGDLAIGNRTNLEPGIDIKGENGYIVVEPSIHPNGKEYVWLRHPRQGIADAPDWLLGMLVRDIKVECGRAGRREPRREPRPWQRPAPAGPTSQAGRARSASGTSHRASDHAVNPGRAGAGYHRAVHDHRARSTT